MNNLALTGDMLDDLAAGILDGGGDVLGDDGTTLVDTVEDSAYPAELQRIAFSVWAFEAGEDIAQTARILEARTGIRLSAGRLRRWREGARWSVVSAEVHQALRIRSRMTTQRVNDLNLVRASRWVSQAFDDPNVSDNVKVKLYENIMDRFGFPRLVRGELWQGADARGGELADLDDDALQSTWQEYSNDPYTTEPVTADPPASLVTLMHNEAPRISGYT